MKNSSTKIVLVDSNGFMFRAIFAWEVNPSIKPTWLYLNMLFSSLQRLKLTREDIIILALDSELGSWRRDLDKDYKANRKENREKHETIDWTYMFEMFNSLLKVLNKSTQFHILKIDKLEADDIISVATRFFKDNECIIVSQDSDFEMLLANPNVKLYSPRTKRFKSIKNPYKILSKKIESEKTDNLISAVLTEKDFEIRNILVNLLELPKEIEQKVEVMLSNLNLNKEYIVDLLPFVNSMKKRYSNIFDKHVEVKEKKKKKKKAKQTLLI